MGDTGRFTVRMMAAVAFALGVGAGEAQPLKKVRIVAATQVVDVNYPTMFLPVTLGYWKQEGYDVDVQAAGGSLQTFQQLVGGNADFAAGSAGSIIQANATSKLTIRVVSSISASDWSLAVDADGPIKTAKDLKGKTVGVFSLSTGGIAFLNGLLRANGLDPAKDIDMVPIGLGAPAVEAMRSGRVQALIYWGSAIASFENAGLKLRQIVGDDWHVYPEYTLATMQATANKNPEMLVGIARGIVKAQVFATASPSCAVKLYWKNYGKPNVAGVDEDTLMKRDLHSLETNLASNVSAFEQYGGGKLWGRFAPAAWKRLGEFMLGAKQIGAPYNTDQLALNLPDFLQKINDFDASAVQASAKACKF
jgi:NitT/TauT family transport system substrate-binding protein